MIPAYLFHVYTLSDICQMFPISMRKAQALKKIYHTPLRPAKKLPTYRDVRDNLKLNLMYSTPKALCIESSIEYIAYSLNIKRRLLPWYGKAHNQQYMRSRKWVKRYNIRAKPDNILYLENLGIHAYTVESQDRTTRYMLTAYKNLQTLKTCNLAINNMKELLEAPDIVAHLLKYGPVLKELFYPSPVVHKDDLFTMHHRRLYTCEDTYESLYDKIDRSLIKNHMTGL